MRVRRLRAVRSKAETLREKADDKFIERRRRYNRRYMRGWRADPKHRLNERENRQRLHYERKVRGTEVSRAPFTNDGGKPVCGLCRKNPAIEEVVRLQVSKTTPCGFVELRIPYCGEC
jgi:hypothetical protein